MSHGISIILQRIRPRNRGGNESRRRFPGNESRERFPGPFSSGFVFSLFSFLFRCVRGIYAAGGSLSSRGPERPPPRSLLCVSSPVCVFVPPSLVLSFGFLFSARASRARVRGKRRRRRENRERAGTRAQRRTAVQGGSARGTSFVSLVSLPGSFRRAVLPHLGVAVSFIDNSVPPCRSSSTACRRPVRPQLRVAVPFIDDHHRRQPTRPPRRMPRGPTRSPTRRAGTFLRTDC